MTAPVPSEIEVRDNPVDLRYEVFVEGDLAGFSQYHLVPDLSQIYFLHTEIDPAFEGRGVGSRLAAGALADARARGLRVIAKCPFISAYVRRHAAEYADLVAR